jgi:hypothetical protein
LPAMAKRESKARFDAYEVVFSALAHPARRRVLLAVYFAGGGDDRRCHRRDVCARQADDDATPPGSRGGRPPETREARADADLSTRPEAVGAGDGLAVYTEDPWSNPLCFVEEGTVYTG